jgi:hypothetical protein
VKIRLIGLPEEVEQAVGTLRTAFEVLRVSRPYPCRDGRQVRVYLDVQPRAAA